VKVKLQGQTWRLHRVESAIPSQPSDDPLEQSGFNYPRINPEKMEAALDEVVRRLDAFEGTPKKKKNRQTRRQVYDEGYRNGWIAARRSARDPGQTIIAIWLISSVVIATLAVLVT
jgi:hypothetical protein